MRQSRIAASAVLIAATLLLAPGCAGGGPETVFAKASDRLYNRDYWGALRLYRELSGRTYRNEEDRAVVRLALLRSAEIQVTMLQTQVFTRQLLLRGRERRRLTWIQHFQTLDPDLDLAGLHLGIRGALRT